MKHNLILLFSVFLLSITLSACDGGLFGGEPTPIPLELQDRSWLTGGPCAPPCWYGLKLEKSSYEEAENLLKTLPFINQERIWESQDSYGYYLRFSCVNSGLDQCGSLYFDSEKILQGVLIRQYYDLSVSQMIEKLGVPSGYKMGDYHVGCVFEVYWLLENISAETIITPDRVNKCDRFESGNIDEDFVIEWLIYSTFQPGEEDLLSWPFQ